MFAHSEHWVLLGVAWLRLSVEALGAITIFVGMLATVRVLANQPLAQVGRRFTTARVTFASYLTFALELQLAADVLSTSISPSWDQLGKLAAIAVIRTALNYFLRQEMRDKEAATSPQP